MVQRGEAGWGRQMKVGTAGSEGLGEIPHGGSAEQKPGSATSPLPKALMVPVPSSFLTSS